MPCDRVRMPLPSPGGVAYVTAFVCSRKPARPVQHTCIVCHRAADQVDLKRCDGPVLTTSGVPTPGATCDAVICVHHAEHVAPDTDLCPRCVQVRQHLTVPQPAKET
jgi:hypothetical protein